MSWTFPASGSWGPFLLVKVYSERYYAFFHTGDYCGHWRSLARAKRMVEKYADEWPAYPRVIASDY